MKELNKLIEQIAFPCTVEFGRVWDARNRLWCEAADDEDANLIAHALNNLSAAPVQSNNLQPSAPPFKNGEEEYQKHLRDRTDEYCAGWFDCKKAYNLQPKEGEQPVSGERTGEEGVDWIDQMERYGLHRETCSRLSATPFTAKEWLESEGITTPPEGE